MARKNLEYYQKKIISKIRTGEKIIDLVNKECINRGLDLRAVIEVSGAAKSTPENWSRSNPKTFDTLVDIYKAMDELEAINKKAVK